MYSFNVIFEPGVGVVNISRFKMVVNAGRVANKPLGKVSTSETEKDVVDGRRLNPRILGKSSAGVVSIPCGMLILAQVRD